MDGCNINLRVRRFKEDLMALYNSYDDLPVEVRLTCLMLITNKATEVSNQAVLEEMQQEAENAKSV